MGYAIPLTELFNTKGELRQPMGFRRLYKTADPTRDKLTQFVLKLMTACDIVEGRIGPTKKRETAIEKAIRKFKGDLRLLTDIVRAKITIEHADQLAAIIAVLGDENSAPLKEAGIRVVVMHNHFATPKRQTGYRGLQFKLAIPTDNPQKLHIVELQIDSPAMDAIYPITHAYKRKAEDIQCVAEQKERLLTEDETQLADQYYAVCQYCNAMVAKQERYDRFLISSEHAFTPEREAALIKAMAQLGITPESLGFPQPTNIEYGITHE